MKNSYQNESLPSRVMTESTPSSTTTTTAGTPSSRLLRRRQHFFGGRRGVITTLVAAVVCFSVFLLRTSLFHAVMSPSYVVLPIELEGMSFRHADDGHDIEDGCEATIILMRHCEKGALKRHCDYIGLERSAYLATLFGNHDERWPAPSYIFAEGPGGRHNWAKRNYREIETVAPLSQKLGVDVDASFNSLDDWELVHHLASMIQSGELCGKLAVVAWKHSQIGHLAHKLGCGQLEGCPNDFSGKQFDMIWQLRFVYNFEVAKDVHYHRHMKPGRWQVFGSVLPENFDPLAFSKRSGDYPSGGRTGTNHWLRETDVIEGEVVTENSDNWDEIKPSFVIG